MDSSLFKFSTQLRVRNYEVDWQGIVHNATYLLYFEVGRIEYLKYIGVNLDLNTIRGEAKVVLVRNEINYISPARFDELLTIYIRVSYIKRTSFAIEGYIEESTTKRAIAENVAIHVRLNPLNDEPMLVDDAFRKAVQAFEGPNTLIDWPTYET